MNDGTWRRYISLYTTEPIEVEPSRLVSSLEKAFKKNGLEGPYNTEINSPDNKKNSPTVKVETSNGTSGVWIGNSLIFLPFGANEVDYGQLLKSVLDTELSKSPARSYSLNSSKRIDVSEKIARETASPEILELLNNKVQEVSKNVTKQISNSLTARDIISVTRSSANGLFVDMAIVIDSVDLDSGQTVSDLITNIDLQILKAHEDEIEQQANSIIIGG